MTINARAEVSLTSRVEPFRIDISPRPPAHRRLTVTLVRPPMIVPVDASWGVGPVPPIGLAYIASVARECGHHVEVVDLAGQDPVRSWPVEFGGGEARAIGITVAEALEQIDPRSDVIGISHMFASEWPVVRDLVEKIREKVPGAFIVLGGENATGFWPWIFEQTDAVDACVLGEGERTFADLLERLASGRSPGPAEGLVLRPGLTTSEPESSLPARIADLDSIPRPAWDLFPMEEYLTHPSHFGTGEGRAIPMTASRGCPFRCTFCSAPQMWTTRYKVRAPAEIADEIATYVAEMNIDEVYFTDLTALTKRQWMLDLCDALEERDLHIEINIPAGTRSERLDAEVFRRLRAVGLRRISLAPETGSQRMIEVYDKKADLDAILQCTRDAASAGLEVMLLIVVAHPEERWSDLFLTARYLLRAAVAGASGVAYAYYFPYPGSADFRQLAESGSVEFDDRYCWNALAQRSALAVSQNAHVDPVWLRRFLRCMFVVTMSLQLLARPRRLVHMLMVVAGRTDPVSSLESMVNLRLRRGGSVDPDLVVVDVTAGVRVRA